MKIKREVKVEDKRTKKFYPFLIIAVAASIMLLSLRMQVATVAAADGDSKPVAVISGTLLVYEGSTVYINGTLSSDPAGNALNYRWKLVYTPPGSTAVLTDAFSANASFTPVKTGVYQVQLIVNNGFVDSKPVYATITVIRRPYMW